MKSFWCACLALVGLGGCLAVPALAQRPPALPLVVSDSVWHPLWEERDSTLQRALERELARKADWNALLASGQLSVSLVDLAHPETPRLAHVNGDIMMYAASLPKIAILLTAMEQLENGRLVETPEMVEDLNQMIRVSSNAAATRMIDRVGGLRAIEATLRSPKYRLYDPQHGGGLWVGKRYSKSTRRNPDPMKGLSHAATANQVSRFYYLLAEGRLVSRQRSKQMLDILVNPGLHHKFVHSLDVVAPTARLFRKSGSWRTWHSDSVLVWGDDWRRYIVVCLVDDNKGEQIVREMIPVIERALLNAGPVAPSAADR